jgi:hypothetical protein
MNSVDQGPTHLVRGTVSEHLPFGIIVSIDSPDFWQTAQGTVTLSLIEPDLRDDLPPIGSVVEAVTLGYRAGSLRLSMGIDHIEMVRSGTRHVDSLA